MFNSKFKKLKVALAVAAMAGSFAAFGGQSTYAFEEYHRRRTRSKRPTL